MRDNIQIRATAIDILDHFRNAVDGDEELILHEFTKRLELALLLSPPQKNDFYSEAHNKLLRLSEIWYCYELLKPVITGYGFDKGKEESIESKNKKWLNSQRVSVYGRIAAEKIRTDNLFLNVDFSYNPSGYASIFNEEYIHDKWLGFYLDEVIGQFFLTGFTNIAINTDEQVDNLIKYLDVLTERASGEQRKFLARGFNKLLGNSSASLESKDILSLVYAMRCNYVHAGELPDSYGVDIEYKISMIDMCTEFFISYCCLVASSIIFELYDS